MTGFQRLRFFHRLSRCAVTTGLGSTILCRELAIARTYISQGFAAHVLHLLCIQHRLHRHPSHSRFPSLTARSLLVSLSLPPSLFAALSLPVKPPVPSSPGLAWETQELIYLFS